MTVRMSLGSKRTSSAQNFVRPCLRGIFQDCTRRTTILSSSEHEVHRSDARACCGIAVRGAAHVILPILTLNAGHFTTGALDLLARFCESETMHAGTCPTASIRCYGDVSNHLCSDRPDPFLFARKVPFVWQAGALHRFVLGSPA
jgi:hypothetical protein